MLRLQTPGPHPGPRPPPAESPPARPPGGWTVLFSTVLHWAEQVLSPGQWEFAFLRVLFPMLRRLVGGAAGPGRDETKLRAAMMLSKVFLQHLGPLARLVQAT